MSVPDITPLPEQPQVFDVSKVDVGAGSDTAAPAGIGSMEDLRTKAPPLYKAIMESIAYQICTKQNKSNERIKRILNESERSNKK